MPTHLHLIWRQNRLNGKESPFGSFLKYTAHKLLSKIKVDSEENKYIVSTSNKAHEIWKRDSLAVEIFSREVARQKVAYIHANPVSGKWKLSHDDIHYYFSLAGYYNDGIDRFGFLNDIFLHFDGE